MSEEASNDPVPHPNSAAYNPYVSMTVTLRQLVELYDVSPDKGKRLKDLNELAVEFSRFTAKE